MTAAGLKQLWINQSVQTFTSQIVSGGLITAGVSSPYANLVGGLTEIGIAAVPIGIVEKVGGVGQSARALSNPFKRKTPTQIIEMFRVKGFEPRGPNPMIGKDGYINPKTGRSYHIDSANSFGEAPHVDVNRLKTYDGLLDKKKYFIGE